LTSRAGNARERCVFAKFLICKRSARWHAACNGGLAIPRQKAAMNSKLRRDRNAFWIFLAAVPIALLAALPLATSTGKAYVAAKARQQQTGTGATRPAPKTSRD
jgi:uncharacterized membrane protein